MERVGTDELITQQLKLHLLYPQFMSTGDSRLSKQATEPLNCAAMD